jgi:Kef-type K+ transport system membrane component KefB
MLEGSGDTDAGPPRHSTDKRQWWDGSTWLPAYSPDGRWWFDGTRWTVAQHRLRWPKWLVIALVIWSVVLVTWLLAAVVIARVSQRQFDVTELVILGALLGVGLVSTGMFGFILGRRGLWKHMAVAAVIGTAALMACYVLAMIAMAQPGNEAGSNAAGAGFALLSIPSLLVVAGLLFLGGGVGWLFRRRNPAIQRADER